MAIRVCWSPGHDADEAVAENADPSENCAFLRLRSTESVVVTIGVTERQNA